VHRLVWGTVHEFLPALRAVAEAELANDVGSHDHLRLRPRIDTRRSALTAPTAPAMQRWAEKKLPGHVTAIHSGTWQRLGELAHAS
jgi:hypothetical protein